MKLQALKQEQVLWWEDPPNDQTRECSLLRLMVTINHFGVLMRHVRNPSYYRAESPLCRIEKLSTPSLAS